MTPIRYWNRSKNCEEIEQVYGGLGVSFLYETRLGKWLANAWLSRTVVSRIYGAIQNSAWSKKKIAPFIAHYSIDMTQFESTDYSNFNQFFIRKFKNSDQRPFVVEADRMPAFAEARYLGFEKVDSSQTFPVKGADLSAERLLENVELARSFEGGPLLIARLCPVDYHRFHFPDSGRLLESYRVPGRLHSVNPLALKAHSDVFLINERHVSILETVNFGRLAYVEVGAMAVGKIVQTHSASEFKRGQEKGYFLFGGSTVIVLGQPGRWRPAADVLEHTVRRQETWIRLGETVAHGS
jgi:phosphatidylserine decarboxylase